MEHLTRTHYKGQPLEDLAAGALAFAMAGMAEDALDMLSVAELVQVKPSHGDMAEWVASSEAQRGDRDAEYRDAKARDDAAWQARCAAERDGDPFVKKCAAEAYERACDATARVVVMYRPVLVEGRKAFERAEASSILLKAEYEARPSTDAPVWDETDN